MRISVVIAAYNAGPWIAATLQSVAAQTHAADEVIVVDDGSTDATAEIAAAHGAHVISIPNSGVSAARNRGIDEARNDWIALLDADDLWRADKLARQVEAIVAAPQAVVISSDHYQFAEDGRLLRPSLLDARRDRFMRLAPREVAPAIYRLTDMGCGLIRLGQALFPSTWLLHRDLTRRIGGFDPALRRCEDYEFLLRMLAHGDLLVVDEPLMGYRVQSNGLSRNAEAMAQGLIDIGERLVAHPERYAPGAAATFASRMREALVERAAFLLKRGESRQARALLARAGVIRRDPRWLAMTLATRLPPGSIAAMSAVRRRLGLRR